MKGNQKSLIYLLGFIVVFSIFIYILIGPGPIDEAILEVKACSNTKEVKLIWDKHKIKFAEDTAFCQVVRNRLNEFNLNQAEIIAIKKWLPSKTNNLNIIIVPDLSYRINDSINNPDQIKNDLTILNKIWSGFKSNVRLKMNTKDRLLLDIADPSQAHNQFKSFADSLIFDLSNHRNKSNKLFFTKEIDTKFSTNVTQLYDVASKQTAGADFVYYFTETLPNRIKKSTLDDNYRNILVILTDGYLEIQKDNSVISITPGKSALKKYCSLGVFDANFPLQTIDTKYSNLETYLFEITERKGLEGCSYRGLKKWWTEWFNSMMINNVNEDFFFRRQDAMNLTENEIESIFSH